MLTFAYCYIPILVMVFLGLMVYDIVIRGREVPPR